MQVTVEPEALAEWSAHARRTGVRLDARLAALDDGLAPLARTWHGVAAEEFSSRHRQWRDAADGLLGTLATLTALAETAHANYRAATAANAAIWRPPAEPAVVAVQAMAAGRRHRIRADVEDIRTAVAALVAAAADLAGAWDALAAGLAGSGAMAGGDAVGAAFAVDYDGMAAAAWQGWRRSSLMVDAIAGGLAATGNNLAEAERRSTAGAARPFPPITAGTGSAPSPAAPPTAGDVPAGGLPSAYWPAADPARLRAAAAAWGGSAQDLHTAVDRAFRAVDGLLAANPDPVLDQMRRFTRAALSQDPTSGLVGVLAGTGGRIAAACQGLADLTERTRARILALLAHYGGGGEWYHPVAEVIDVVVRLRAAHALAAAGDAYLLDLHLSTIHDEHVRAVDSVRAELHPAGADRLARVATAMAPPVPSPADTCAVAAPDGTAGTAVPEVQRQALIAEVRAAGHRISPTEVVQIARAPDGRVVWLERGDEHSGLSHILRAGRIDDFTRRGVDHADIAGLAVRAVTQGTRLGRVTQDGVVYEVDIGGGRRTQVVVVVGSNGYVVTARPRGDDETIRWD